MKFVLNPEVPKPVGRKINVCPDGWYTSKDGNVIFKQGHQVFELYDSSARVIGDTKGYGNLYVPYVGEINITVP